MNVKEHYARIRAEHPTMRASQAILWARHEVKVDAFLSDIGWQGPHDHDWPRDAPSDLVAIATVPGGSIRVYWDTEPYDWGDIEPTDEEREALEVIGIDVLDGAGETLDSCWGYGFNGRTSDLEREATSFAIELGAVERIADKAAEVAHWSARDVRTVNA